MKANARAYLAALSRGVRDRSWTRGLAVVADLLCMLELAGIKNCNIKKKTVAICRLTRVRPPATVQTCVARNSKSPVCSDVENGHGRSGCRREAFAATTCAPRWLLVGAFDPLRPETLRCGYGYLVCSRLFVDATTATAEKESRQPKTVTVAGEKYRTITYGA